MFLTFVFLIFVGCVSVFGQEKTSPTGIPDWVQNHFGFMTKDSGRWITDNSKFKSESEPFDQYAVEFTWGIGKQSIKGRLLALKDTKEVGMFWEYLALWHPAEKRVVFQQFGGTGVFGTGEMRAVESAEGKFENHTELTFYARDGTSWKDLHILTEGKDEYTAESFGFKVSESMPILELGAWTQIMCEVGDVVFAHYQLGHAAVVNTYDNDRIAVYFRVWLRGIEQDRWHYLTNIWEGWKI